MRWSRPCKEQLGILGSIECRICIISISIIIKAQTRCISGGCGIYGGCDISKRVPIVKSYFVWANPLMDMYIMSMKTLSMTEQFVCDTSSWTMDLRPLNFEVTAAST